ncbi:DUF6436 domain-containing protein [Thioalkalivibrio sulfidiphilus]|uniref:DUF6436 domain-containing protein n=1 Tax=Thioalkalivibrio sulfidiphilus TaxID=1033854 RepID=UPI000366AC66|nr:DUF6436 domain-containing protein [Thioalkalivibrio sulfidiphilus]
MAPMTHANPQRPHRWRQMAALALVLPWLAGTAVAFWWFEQGPGSPPVHAALASLDEARVDALTRQLHKDSVQEGIHLVHFWDPACACSQASSDHLHRILAAEPAQDTRITVVVPDEGSLERALRHFRRIDGLQVTVADPDTAPPASPLAAVLSPEGSLAYLGPYRASTSCRPAADGPVADTLLDLQRGEDPRRLNLLDTACFCAWPETHRRT